VSAVELRSGVRLVSCTVKCNMDRHNMVRTRSASGGVRLFNTTTPSIMSLTAAVNGRSVRRTATTPPIPPGARRTVRSTPTTRGGHRKPGTIRPAACTASERTRAAEAK